MRDSKGRFVKNNEPWHKGKTGVYSEESLKKFSEAKKGKPNWRKGVVGVYKYTQEQKKRHSERMKSLNHKVSPETKLKISIANKGSKNGCWKGGISNSKGRVHLIGYVYKKFRLAVLERDKKCVFCGSEERLEVDHIKPFAQYPELRLDVNNGRVLCHDCHKKTDTYGKVIRLNK